MVKATPAKDYSHLFVKMLSPYIAQVAFTKQTKSFPLKITHINEDAFASSTQVSEKIPALLLPVRNAKRNGNKLSNLAPTREYCQIMFSTATRARADILPLVLPTTLSTTARVVLTLLVSDYHLHSLRTCFPLPQGQVLSSYRSYFTTMLSR